MAETKAPRITWLVEPTIDDDGVQRSAGLDQYGREHGDPTPLRPPAGLSVRQGDELHTAIRNLFQRERAAFQAAVEAEQFESEEEANDFITEDELFLPGNEPWEDVHEFPAEPAGNGRSEPAASQRAPNGEDRAAEHATRQPSDQTISGGLASGSSVGLSGETPSGNRTVAPVQSSEGRSS